MDDHPRPLRTLMALSGSGHWEEQAETRLYERIKHVGGQTVAIVPEEAFLDPLPGNLSEHLPYTSLPPFRHLRRTAKILHERGFHLRSCEQPL